MAASSDRKIEANRRNAARSTGPKSAEGKEKSRRNGWKHGMAAVVVVPEEETKALDLAVAGWTEQVGPGDVVEASLVHQMAAADVRMRRCAQINESAMEGDAVEAVRRWEAKQRHRVRRKAQDLKHDPVNVVADLEASSFGCDWMIRRWRFLDGGLKLGFGWPQAHLEEALRLLGYVQVLTPTAASDPAAVRLWTLAMHASPTGIKAAAHFQPDPTVPEGWTEAMPLLRAFIAAQIERLEGLREEAWEAVDGPEAEAVASKALMDAGKDAQVRHRYYRDAQLAQHRAMKQLMVKRNGPRKGEQAGAEAPRGVTGAAILEALCVEVVAREKAEAAEASSRRTEPNAAAHRTDDQQRKSNPEKDLGREAPADPRSESRRTGPRFPGSEAPPKGLGAGQPAGPTASRPSGGAA